MLYKITILLKTLKEKEVWVDTPVESICLTCTHILELEIPSHLRKYYSTTFGVVKLDQRQRDVQRSKSGHLQSQLHIWTAKKLSEVKEDEEEKKALDKKKCRNLINNVIQNYGTSSNFVRIVDLDHLEGINLCDKNDGRQFFFRMRDLCFKICSSLNKTFFKERVSFFAAYLYKVTQNHISYIVL